MLNWNSLKKWNFLTVLANSWIFCILIEFIYKVWKLNYFAKSAKMLKFQILNWKILSFSYLKHDKINSIGRLQLFLFCIKLADDESRGKEALVSLSATGKYNGVDFNLSSIFPVISNENLLRSPEKIQGFIIKNQLKGFKLLLKKLRSCEKLVKENDEINDESFSVFFNHQIKLLNLHN